MKHFTTTVAVIVLVLVLGLQTETLAHCNYTDCGRIVNGKFYSANYPNGVIATIGNEGWVQQVPSNGAASACSSRNSGSGWSSNTMFINGQEYWKYEHKYICNIPLDDYIPFIIAGFALIGFWYIRNSNSPILHM